MSEFVTEFGPRFTGINGQNITAQDKPPRRTSRLRRLYVMLRKLVRKRQESQAMLEKSVWAMRVVDSERAQSAAAKKDAARQIEEVRAATAKEIAVMAKRIANRDQALSELRERMELKITDLNNIIISRERDIKDLVELQIPKLERELKVERADVQFLETLLEKKLTREERQIAVDNQRIIEAEGVNEEGQALRKLLRGDMGTQRGER